MYSKLGAIKRWNFYSQMRTFINKFEIWTVIPFNICWLLQRDSDEFHEKDSKR